METRYSCVEIFVLVEYSCAEIERTDNRDGSKALERYLEDKLRKLDQDYWICRIPTIPGVFSRTIANYAFGTYMFRTEHGILKGELQEETVEHPSFGTVLVKCLTFVEFDPDVL